MSKVGSFLAGSACAAAVFGALWWYVLLPHSRDFEARTVAAERLAQRAKRDASDCQQWAEKEQRRARELAAETESLRKVVAAAPPPGAPTSTHAPQPPAAPDDLSPELWDRDRLNLEIMGISRDSGRAVASPRYPLVVRALKTKGDEGFQLLVDVLSQDMPKDMKSACATLLGGLGDPRAAKPLLAAWSAEKDPELRRAVLRGLANAPGDEQTPVLVAAWNDTAGEAFARRLAVHGLARRKHEIALAVVAGDSTTSTPALRAQAMDTLHAAALADGWKDATLVPVFGKGLRTADGDGQRRIALLSLEGFWSKDSLADLDAFASSAVPTELATRARRDAEAIRTDKPRPEAAGGSATPPGGAAPNSTDPVEPDAPPAPPK